MEVCQAVDQPKIASTVVQKWPRYNEVINLSNTKFQKITISRVPHFKSIPTIFTQKKQYFVLLKKIKNFEIL